MRSPFTQLYLHCVWATWDRMPLLVPSIEQSVYSAVLARCYELKCEPVAIGGMPDHVHVLVRLASTLAVAHFVKDVKGASSHLVTHQAAPAEFFKWQGSYGAFTVSKESLPAARAYVERQKEHRIGGEVVSDWEQTVIEVEHLL